MTRFKKYIIWLIGLFFSLILLTLVGLYIFEDKLKKQIVSIANENLKGELIVNNIEYTLISSYPNVVILIDSIFLYETKNLSSHEKAVLTIERLELTLNSRALIGGKYLVDSLFVRGGGVGLINYNDSSLNILNAIGATTSENDDKSEPISLQLKELSIIDFDVNYDDRLTRQVVASNLNFFESSILLDGDSLIGDFDLEYSLDSMYVDGKRILTHHRLALKTNFESDLESFAFSFSDGSIKMDLLEADIEGFYNDADSGFVDISISANHKELQELTKMEFLNAESIPDIKSGELFIDARIVGKTKEQLPLIEAFANLRDVQVDNSYGKIINKAGFNLKLKSTSTSNMLESNMVIDSIHIDFVSGGFLNGNVEILNFEQPSFKVNWEASENLEELYRLIDIPEIEKMDGKVTSNGSLSGEFNLKTNKLLSHKGAAMVLFENNNIILNKGSYPLNSINGTAYLSGNDVGFDEVSLFANGNFIKLNGKAGNLMPFVLGKPTQLLASISIQSHGLNTESLLAFDTAIANDTKYKIDEFDVAIMAELSSRALAKYELIPTGKLDIQKFTARVQGVPPIVDFSGKIEVNEDLFAIKDFKGIIAKSKVNFSVAVSNYADYLQSNTTEQMEVDVSLKSEKANAKDFFTINHKFVLPKNYEEEILKDVAINAKIITTNTELQKKGLLPELELQLTGLQFQTYHTPVVFKDIFVFALVKDNNVYINSMFGKFGRSDVFMNAQFDNVIATKDTISRPLKSRITFNSNLLDLNELVKLSHETETESEVTTSSETTNPFADKFPITELQLNIGELIYYDASIKELSGLLKIEENNFIHLHDIKLKSGEYGTFEFDGELDASSRTEAILKSTIKISDVDLSNLNVKYIQNEEEVKISDHFAGKINGEVVADVPILPDFSFDLARLTGEIKVKMTDGALINYAPLEEMGKYFKNKDLNYIKFDVLKNTMIFNGGKMLLPFMTINTTLGTINLMGFQTMDYDMSYDIQVPIKLVAGSALNSLFAAKKGDDTKEDKVKKGGKGKYITVHISGSADQYKFKLGKKHVLTAPPGFAVD
jgi:AsmA-like protein